MLSSLDDFLPSDPTDAARWSRLLHHLLRRGSGGEGLRDFLDRHPEGPHLHALLRDLADDPEAMAEDRALLGWEALEVDEDPESAQEDWEQAHALAPAHPEVRILGTCLRLGGEARAEALAGLAEEIRAGLDPESLAALDEGRGSQEVPCLPLHRCQAERIETLAELGRFEEVVALAEEVFMEAGSDPFGIFPAFVQAALDQEDWEALDQWTEEMGQDSPALQEWLLTYLAQTADEPGGAFQHLRRARKLAPGVELCLLKWVEQLALRPKGEPDEAPLPFPASPTEHALLLILGPTLASTPSFMEWLRKKRSLR